MGRFRSLGLLLVVTFAAACQILPSDLAKELLPARATTSYRVAESAFNQLIERHVDKPDSKLLVTGALDAVDEQLKKEGATPAYDRPALTGTAQVDLARFAETIDLLAEKYPKLDPEVEKAGLDRPRFLERVATDGMAKSLKECHTYFLTPDRAKTFNRPPEEYSGIGAQISPTRPNEQLPEIAAIFPNTPAERSGLRAGDRIKSVDGGSVSGFTAEEVATRIRGPEGTTVNIIVVRAGTEHAFSIIRAKLTPPRVISRDLESGTIGYLRVTAFNGDVTRQTSDAVRSLLATGVRGFVLDLRDNPGGDLSAAQDIGSIFTKGALVQQTGRDGQQRDLRTNDRWFWSSPKPLVVLVNERSASGSEIVAAGVRANGSGIVVGTKTAGCVGIGQPRELPDGSMLLITIAKMQDSKTGEELNGEGRGVRPDVATGTDVDQQLTDAVAALRQRL
ncbi:MAG: PDZ domain-containing protein [Chloroflexi bacterium]|nr:PDZ domain-containing protein [Chloroflexota bacterium]